MIVATAHGLARTEYSTSISNAKLSRSRPWTLPKRLHRLYLIDVIDFVAASSNRFSSSSRQRGLNKSMPNIPSECRSANIVRYHGNDSTRRGDSQADWNIRKAQGR